MQIKINCDDAFLTLSDEALDNGNFVDLTIIQKDDEFSLTIDRNELMCALIAFDAKYSRKDTQEEIN